VADAADDASTSQVQHLKLANLRVCLFASLSACLPACITSGLTWLPRSLYQILPPFFSQQALDLTGGREFLSLCLSARQVVLTWLPRLLNGIFLSRSWT
jgi:hypothetical protein